MILSIVGVGLAVGIQLFRQRGEEDASAARGGGGARVVPVEVKRVETGPMEQRRVFSGSLTPSAELNVAPRIPGRIAEILVDLSDPVERGQTVAVLDDAEYTQAVARAQADVAVARAQAVEARNRLELSEREFNRIQTLADRGVASESALDNARADFLMRQSAYEVSEATVQAREAALATAEIQLSHTRVTASWSGGDSPRVVSGRYADEGDSLAANSPIVSVVRLSPIRAVFYVPERDFGLLEAGQTVEIRTDAHPGETFAGQISRIAPVFREDSRQARVEVLSENAEQRLNPGMFVRAGVVLRAEENARIVPETAVTRRGGESGVFHVDEGGESVSWVPVETGIESGGRIQIVSPELEGRVVVLGQQFLGNGSAVRIVNDEDDES
ncbi:MAG: efflux RND transporter periplasmic adaptor subunit [Verrucomicrobia bacterium]|nr:efflux RND transporter periplasmic adaptor subunit [Verrucomicrobiota bacterium]MCH8527657.1 efflux RND transporter periplasmic adaptor subunit [Kiritimatiellia bacterium]